MTQTGIVIIHYSSIKNVQECLRSIFASDHAEKFFPIVVDNNAKESSDLLIEEFGAKIHRIKLEKNLGFTGANNVGIQWAKKNLSSKYVAILNDDTTVDKSTFEILLNTLDEHPKAGAIVPLIYFSKGREFHSGYHKDDLGKVIWYGGGIIDWKEVVAFHFAVDEVDRNQLTQVQETPFATGCCTIFRLSALEQVGLFDNNYFLYMEDVDLSQRLRLAGWQILLQPKTHLWHKNAGSSGSGSDLHVYYQTRNRYRFGLRYAPLRTRLFLLKHAWNQLRTGSPVVKRAILDVIRNRYGIQPDLH